MTDRHAYVVAVETPRAACPVAGVAVLEEGRTIGTGRASASTLNLALVMSAERAVELGAQPGSVLVIHLQSADAIAALAGEKPCREPLAGLVARVAPRLGDLVIPHFDPAPAIGYELAQRAAMEAA